MWQKQVSSSSHVLAGAQRVIIGLIECRLCETRARVKLRVDCMRGGNIEMRGVVACAARMTVVVNTTECSRTDRVKSKLDV